MNHVSLAVAFLALAVSCLSLVYARHVKAAEDLTEIEQERRIDEIRREAAGRLADVTVELSLPAAKASRQIGVRNAGPARATEILITYLEANDGLPSPETSRWSQLRRELGPGQSSWVNAGLTAKSSKRFRGAIDWRDGNGMHRREFELRA
jgi:hypothetical protein